MDKSKTPRKHVAICLMVQIPVFFLALYLIWGIDIWTGISLLYPGYMICVAYVLILLSFPLVLLRRAPVVAIPTLWMIFAVSLPFVTNSSIKPLLRGMNDLEIGMSKVEVLETINRQFAGSPYPTPVVFNDSETRLCMKPRGRDPVFSAESLLVHLQDGHFIHAHFSAD